MLNMDSPVVQNLMQSQSGFNPYAMNNGYIPQQPTYQNYSGYNPYIANRIQQQDELNDWTYSYDPMPKVVINESRGINTSMTQNYNEPLINNPYINNGFNSYAFNGYMNPILMKNQLEADRIRQREEAIQQAKIWKALLKGQISEDDEFDLDELGQRIESLYYQEPIQEEIPIKRKIIIDKNNHIAEIEARLAYCRQNNIPIIDSAAIARNNFYNYYNRINSIIGNPDECDLVDYFTRVYPELKFEQLSWEAERYNKDLKNKYNSKDFNKLIDKVTGDKSDSYYYKLMESFAEDGARFTNNDGLTITADEMEIKLPERLLKNRQDQYYEQRKKFYDSIFNKKG